MKGLFRRMMSFLLASLLIVSLLPVSNAALTEDTSLDGELRVIITSDMHHVGSSKYYGVKNEDRLQLWLDSINAEHERDPIDLIIINGDVSLDHYYANGAIAGTYMGSNKVSYTEKFMNEYVSQLPEGVPYFILAGNHEQYNNDQWKGYVGNDRQCAFSIEGNLFIMTDNFNSYLEPNATENSTYTQTDVEFVKEAMAAYPDDDVWLVSHYFSASQESDAFNSLVKNNDRIKGLFGGHNHMNNVTYSSKWGNKPYAMTGTFARSGAMNASNVEGEPSRWGYESKELTETQQASLQANIDAFWGFRELLITPSGATSNFIGVDTGNTAPYYYGVKIDLERRITDSVTYDVQQTTATEQWDCADDGIYYIGTAADMLAFSLACQTDTFAGKTVKLVRDIDMVGVQWTKIPKFSGTFDGCGHQIKNLSLFADSGTLALFEELADATICNLRVCDGSVRLTGSNSAATFAVVTSGECLFENVYVRMEVSVDSTKYRAGGFVAYVKNGTTHFNRCVSECTFAGMRAGGFLAQLNINTAVKLTDCAFIGDLSGAGKWSAGLVGLTVGNLEMTRCVSLGKGSANAETGMLVFLDHQNQSTTVVSDVKLADCFAAVDTADAIGAQSTRSFRFNFEIGYTNGESFTLATDATNTVAANLASIEAMFGYLANGSNVYLTSSNLAALCPQLTDWSVSNGTVSYADGKSVTKILPSGAQALIDGTATEALPENICACCGGNLSLGVNYGDGTHTVLCDRCDNILYVKHTYEDGICACGQRENKFVLLDFLPTSEKISESDWVSTNTSTGVLTANIDTLGLGTMSGSVENRDAYVYMNKAMQQEYVIQSGDIMELRLKGEITAGSTQKTAVYITTDQNPKFAEANQLSSADAFTGEYQIFDLGSLDAFVGQTLQKVRFDIFQHGSTNLSASYSLDYLYIGPSETAPSRSNQNIFFDFTNDAEATRRYATSVYNGYNYDVVSNWTTNLDMPLSIDHQAGTMTMDFTSKSSVSVLEPVGENKTFKWGSESSEITKNFYYDPSDAEVLQVRMKLEGADNYSESVTSQYLRFFYHPVGADLWSSAGEPNEWKESILAAIDSEYLTGGSGDGEYFTLKIPLTGKKFTTYEAIDGMMFNFYGLGSGKVTFDYIYIGPAQTDTLLFDFEDDAASDLRYDNITYRDYNYDTMQHWYVSTDLTDANISNGALNFTVGTTALTNHNQFVQTSIAPDCTVDPLYFTPKSGDVLQIRYRVNEYDEQINASTEPTLTVYGWNNFSQTYQGTSWTPINVEKVGEYVVQAWPIPSNWSIYDLTRFRISVRGFLNSSMSIDYFYIGSLENAPIQPYTVKFMDFGGTEILQTVQTYGEAISYSEQIPTRSYGELYHYTFSHWEDAEGNVAELENIASDMTYYPVFLEMGHVLSYENLSESQHIASCDCGFSAEQTHQWSEGIVTKEANCTQAGVLEFTCGDCSVVKTEEIAMLDHTIVTDSAVAPTCTKSGLTEGSHCSICNEVLITQSEVAALGHCYETIVTAPTCTSDGYTNYACSACGDSYTDDITSALGHSYQFTNNGEDHTITCRVCDDYDLTTEHIYYDGVCLCGAIEIVAPKYEPKETLKFTMSISVGAEMAVSYNIMGADVNSYTDFYLEVKKDVAGGEPVTTIYGITADREQMTAKVNPATGEALMYQVTYKGINAKEMGDNFSTTLYAVGEDGTIYYGNTVVDSIKSFLVGKIDAETSIPELKTMAVDMLKYGAAAQARLGYNTENLVTADLSEEQLAYATQEIPEAVDHSSATGEGVSVNTSITVTSRVQLNLSCVYTTATAPDAIKCVITDSEGKVLAEIPTTNKGNIMFSAVYEDVGAKEMREVINATFYEGEKVISKTVSWSVESYVAQARAKTNATEDEIAMVNAMLTYGDAVAAYMLSLKQ